MSFAESLGPGGGQDVRVRFSDSPILISVRNRVPWRTVIMCLILSRFRQAQAAVQHLHVVTWSIETDGTRELFKLWLSGARPMDRSTVRIDPELNVTVTLAYGLDLVTITGTRKVALTDDGKALAAEIDAHGEMLRVEKGYLDSLGQLNESRLQSILGALAE
jgi:hypothetical protein